MQVEQKTEQGGKETSKEKEKAEKGRKGSERRKKGQKRVWMMAFHEMTNICGYFMK